MSNETWKKVDVKLGSGDIVMDAQEAQRLLESLVLPPQYRVMMQQVNDHVYSWEPITEMLPTGTPTTIWGPGRFRVEGYDDEGKRMGWSKGVEVAEGHTVLTRGLVLIGEPTV